MARASVFAVVASLLSAVSAAADEAVWIGPATGAWNAPANWSTGVVPSFPGGIARIDDNAAQNTRVEYRTGPTGGQVVIDPGDILAIINGSFNAGISLRGTIGLEGNSSTLNGSLVNLGGEFRLNGTGATAFFSFLNNLGEIHGGGAVTLSTIGSPTTQTSYNHHIIRGDHATIPLKLQLPTNADFENFGRLIAKDGGKLQVQQGSLSLAVGLRGGRIEAHPGSTVILGTAISGLNVEDAVLAAVDDADPLTAAPSFQFYAKLTDVTLEGNFQLTGADFVGTLTNKGQISTGAFSTSPNWHNDIIGDVVLTGGGTVQLGDSTQALFGTVGTGATGNRLVNTDNVIRGRGGELLVSWAGFTNRHIVQADVPLGGEMVFYNGLSEDGFVNSGVMKAIYGGRLRLGYQGSSGTGTMQNFEGGDLGEIIAAENSTVALANIHIKGGVVRAEGTDAATRGKYVADGLVVLEDVTLEGSYRFVNSSSALSTITLVERNYNKGSLAGRFAIATTAELAGGGEIVGEGGTLFSLAVQSSFINADNLIRGAGTVMGPNSGPASVFARFTNRSTIRAEGAMSFTGSQMLVVNRGRIEAGPGVTLALSTQTTTTNFEDGVAGTIHAAAGAVITARTIDGGILSTEGTGVIRPGTIKDLRNLGTIEASQTIVQGTILNDGIIKGVLRFDTPYARFEGSGQWQAPGTVFTNSATNGPQHTILGNGDVPTNPVAYSSFVNQGTIRTGDAAGLRFGFAAGSFENSGLVHAPAGRSLAITSSVGRATNTGTLQVDGNLEIAAMVGVFNDSSGLIDVRGTLTLKESRLRNRGGKIIGNGEIVGPMTSGPLILNDGIIEPGPGLATLSIGDDFQQLAGGQLKLGVSGGLDLAGDLLHVDGGALLAGGLTVSRVGEAALAAGDSFTLLTSTGGVQGEFEQVSLPALDANLFWYVQYAPTAVWAHVADVIPGDFTRDGSVGAEDYVWWRHVGGTPEQYNDWAANFGRVFELPTAPTAAAVPEPMSAWIALLWGSIALRLSRGRS